MKVAFLLPLVASTACAFVLSPSTHRLTTKLNLFKSVEEAISEAQRICAEDPSSQACKVAWDIVEELEAADSHKGGFVAGNNDSTDYTAFMGSLDILMQKIDGKMDQLKATTVKLSELGVTDPNVLDLYARADDMKQALVNAKAALS